MKVLKKLLLAMAVVLVVLIVGAAMSYCQLTRRPAFYHLYRWDSEQRAVLNQRAVDKIALTQNMLVKAQAEEVRARRQGETIPTRPGAMMVTFSEEELNAMLLHNLGDYDQYAQNPGIYLKEGRIILAAEVKDFGYVISLDFEPRLDEQGQLRLKLLRSTGGRLPLPRVVVNAYTDRIKGGLLRRLPAWQASSAIDSRGASNSSMVMAAMAKLLLSALGNEPADAVLFMPGEKGKALPLRLTGLEVKDEAISLTVEPMSAEEREELAGRVRMPWGSAEGTQ